jgi:asparaginyl-tRNA synthetase
MKNKNSSLTVNLENRFSFQQQIPSPSYKLKGAYQDPSQLFSKVVESPWYKLISKLQSSIVFSTFEFYKNIQFQPVILPITSQAISSPMGLGSDSLPVEIKLFGEKTYLADSMQFHLEYLLRQGSLGVFYIMPTFRGEDFDHRHLNQFFHSEVELLGDWSKIQKLANDYVGFLTKAILNDPDLMNNLESIIGCTQHLINFFQNPPPSITFDEAVMLLKDEDQYIKKHPVRSLSSKGELKLIELFHGPLWITHFDADSVPFYQASVMSSDGVKKALCGDLLMGIGEVLGAGQRHTHQKDVLASLKDHQNDPSNYQWYLEMKAKYPMVTSGFGLGIERYLLWVLKHNDIRDIQLFNRLKGYHSVP